MRTGSISRFRHVELSADPVAIAIAIGVAIPQALANADILLFSSPETEMLATLPPLLKRRLRRPAPLWAAILATVAGLVAAYLLKRPCIVNPWADNFQYIHLCYNDIQPLFGVRGISHGLIPYVDVEMEYPVLTGMFMDFAGRVLRALSWLGMAEFSNEDYFRVSAFFLAPFAFVVTMLLRKRVTAARLMLWAIGSPLVLHAFTNWDLLAVAGAVWGLVLYERNCPAISGAALAAGASAKLYPSFFLPGMILARLADRDKRSIKRMVISFAIAFALINVPWIIASSGLPRYLDIPGWPEYANEVSLRKPGTNGWLSIWLFHADRYPDLGTVWFWIAHHGRVLLPWKGWEVGQAGYRDLVSWISLLLFVAGSAMFLRRGWVRRGAGGYPVVAVGLGIVSVFLLVSKVHSPQYALWVIPMVAMLNVPWRYVLFYMAADLAVFVSGFYYFTAMNPSAPGWMGVFEIAVWARALALAGLAAAAWSAEQANPDDKTPPQIRTDYNQRTVAIDGRPGLESGGRRSSRRAT